MENSFDPNEFVFKLTILLLCAAGLLFICSLLKINTCPEAVDEFLIDAHKTHVDEEFSSAFCMCRTTSTMPCRFCFYGSCLECYKEDENCHCTCKEGERFHTEGFIG